MVISRAIGWLWALVLLLATLSACGPRTFDDCILSGSAKAPTKEAADVAFAACVQKFPPPPSKPDRALTNHELQLLIGEPAGNDYDSMSGVQFRPGPTVGTELMRTPDGGWIEVAEGPRRLRG